MKNILILNSGTRNKLISYFLNECKDKCEVIVTDNFDLAPTLYIADKFYLTKRYYEEGYVEEIIEICKENNVGLVVSLIDPELTLLSENKDKFDAAGVLLNTSTPDIIERCFDKYQTYEFLKENGFNYIKTYNNLEVCKQALADKEVAFPLFAKPYNGSGSLHIEKIENMEQLENYCAKYSDYLIQEYMGGYEIGVDVYVDLISKEPINMFTKKKLKMRAGETDKSVSFKNEKLKNMIIDFVQKMGLLGANDIDVFEKDGEFYISEINPRFGGGYLHAYECGVNFPQYLINNMNGIVNTPSFDQYEENVYMMKYFDVRIEKLEDRHE